MTTVVLGWDGLDPDRLACYDCGVEFGEYRRTIQTIVNETLGTPHTYELWPTMITGQRPSEHGVHAETYVEGGAWDSSLLNLVTRLSRPLPDTWRKAVGKRLRDRGANMQHRRINSYSRTVFDDYDSVAIGIPNGRSQTDDQLNIASDRGAALGQFLERSDGARAASVPLQTLDERLWREGGGKLAATEAAVMHEPDLVWVWLGVLDSVGHVAPTVEEHDRWVEQHYERAAKWTGRIRGYDSVETVISVSDHGLQGGEHTHEAVIACDREGPTRLTRHVCDVAATVDHLATDSEPQHEQMDQSSTSEVREQLDALGYL